MVSNGIMKGLIVIVMVNLPLMLCQNCQNCQNCPNVLTEDTVQKLYPGLFRTDEEQNVFETIVRSQGLKEVETTFQSSEKCYFWCRKKKSGKSMWKRDIWVEHGCCISSVMFPSPEILCNLSGTNRTLLQYPTVKQYIALHICQVSDSCYGCTCTQESSLIQAVVMKPGITNPVDVDDTELDWFLRDGCCKCVTV